MAFSQTFYTCGAQLDHGELGGYEKAVEQNQQQRKKNKTEVSEKY